MRSTRLPVLLFLAIGAASTHAACSRPLKVPLAPMGQNVVKQADGHVVGAYPALLRRIGEAGGCRFELETMPRARAEMLFQKATADLLVPASRTPQRDAIAEFVPLFQSRPSFVYLPRDGIVPPTSIDAVLAQAQWRVALVRGYDYGLEYQRLAQGLREQGRVVWESDPAGVSRALATGMATATIINRHHLHGPVDADPRVRGLIDRLRSEPLRELDWSETGLYLSTRSLTPQDRELLRSLLEQAAASGMAWQTMSSHYPASVLEGGMRPRP